ncbi:uncharacterized protein LOC131291223 [Anopheles ziemanni]|uniref:uncharacterized protein LOC131269389 n=1 Tax=Anopheles coustani TaxID=139045 RepID=UPI002658EF04|nr:uncharacterized protein LOC131269389 [Anopheles coustani]XP_058176391.1 uncharacterized protein LOC131291223 [Anopheles ziemanni]
MIDSIGANRDASNLCEDQVTNPGGNLGRMLTGKGGRLQGTLCGRFVSVCSPVVRLTNLHERLFSNRSGSEQRLISSGAAEAEMRNLVSYTQGGNPITRSSRGMVVRSTFFPRKDIHKATWRSPDLRTCNQIDHVLIDGRFFSDVTNIRSYRQPNVSSDHYLLGVCMRSKLAMIYKPRVARAHRFNIDLLKDNEVAVRYGQTLEAALPSEDEASTAPMEEVWTKIRHAVESSASSSLGARTRSRTSDWFDAECQLLADQKNFAWGRMLQAGTRANVEQSSEPAIDMCRDREGGLLTSSGEVVERWRQHFEEHLNGVNLNRSMDAEVPLGAPGHDDDYPVPSLYEVVQVMRKLKSNRAAGDDQLSGELFQHGGESLARVLHLVIGKVWEMEELPQDWMTGVVVPVFKKGDRLDCENYRGITIPNAAYKIFSQLLLHRLLPLAENFVGEYQAGFMDGRSTTDQLFTLRQILQKCREYNCRTHHVFIDFKAAYDSIDRQQLWMLMKEFQFPNKLIRLCRATMGNVMCSVRVGGVASAQFASQRGLRQGDSLSCILFNVALEGVIRRVGIDTRGTIFWRSIQLLGYADDIDIVAINKRTVAETYAGLKSEAQRVGLQINTSKTKYMQGLGSRDNTPDTFPGITLDNDTLEEVDSFVYLGSQVTCDSDTSLEIRRRILAGNRTFCSLLSNYSSYYYKFL